jgi:hypothetical protein
MGVVAEPSHRLSKVEGNQHPLASGYIPTVRQTYTPGLGTECAAAIFRLTPVGPV